MKVGFVKGLCSANDDPVISKQQAAHRCDKGDRPQIAELKFSGGIRWRSRSGRWYLHDSTHRRLLAGAARLGEQIGGALMIAVHIEHFTDETLRLGLAVQSSTG